MQEKWSKLATHTIDCCVRAHVRVKQNDNNKLGKQIPNGRFWVKALMELWVLTPSSEAWYSPLHATSPRDLLVLTPRTWVVAHRYSSMYMCWNIEEYLHNIHATVTYIVHSIHYMATTYLPTYGTS